MPEHDDPYSRDDLIVALEEAHQEVTDFFGSLSRDELFHHPEEGVWSAVENLIHLIKAVRPVASAMRYPKLVLRVLFGTSHSASRRFGEIRELYRGQLGAGARAAGRFLPPTLATDGPEAAETASRAFDGWSRAGRDLVRAVRKWRDQDLDRYRLPHPLLGKLTVREILFFTLYHELLHVEIVSKRMPAIRAQL